MTVVTCRLTAKDRDQLRNPTLGSRVWATFFAFYCHRNERLIDLTECTDAAAALDGDLSISNQLYVLSKSYGFYDLSCLHIPLSPLV